MRLCAGRLVCLWAAVKVRSWISVTSGSQGRCERRSPFFYQSMECKDFQKFRLFMSSGFYILPLCAFVTFCGSLDFATSALLQKPGLVHVCAFS